LPTPPARRTYYDRKRARVRGLAEAGYHALWRSVRAADIGAAHRRERVFLLAWYPRHRAKGRSRHRKPATARVSGVAAYLFCMAVSSATGGELR
jgi:site-specific DNA-cytosine methylase